MAIRVYYCFELFVFLQYFSALKKYDKVEYAVLYLSVLIVTGLLSFFLGLFAKRKSEKKHIIALLMLLVPVILSILTAVFYISGHRWYVEEDAIILSLLSSVLGFCYPGSLTPVSGIEWSRLLLTMVVIIVVNTIYLNIPNMLYFIGV